jgi:hypothetical protein
MNYPSIRIEGAILSPDILRMWFSIDHWASARLSSIPTR